MVRQVAFVNLRVMVYFNAGNFERGQRRLGRFDNLTTGDPVARTISDVKEQFRTWFDALTTGERAVPLPLPSALRVWIWASPAPTYASSEQSGDHAGSEAPATSACGSVPSAFTAKIDAFAFDLE